MLLNLNEHQTSLDTGLSSPEEETDTCFNEIHGRMDYGPIFRSCNPFTFEWTDIGGQAGPSRPYPLCEDSHEAEDARLAACYDPFGFDLQAGDFINLSQSQVSNHPYSNHTPTEEPPNAYHVHELSPQSHPPLDLYMSSFFV
ncbi:hypothetical protein N7541_007075 [Penicillium brevicompactum]|uniref:Uncharacterized protein n=1 Tax=Penicillium brevicompactum TaxID=5074 RepID=A0A9W9R270_PENBR|nr:hypothetical protein N7541_007075 [Penicillium brevicompactum]